MDKKRKLEDSIVPQTSVSSYENVYPIKKGQRMKQHSSTGIDVAYQPTNYRQQQIPPTQRHQQQLATQSQLINPLERSYSQRAQEQSPLPEDAKQERDQLPIGIDTIINKKRKSVAQPRPRLTVPPRCIGTECDVRENDVLAGRGGKVNSHLGNVLFRKLIRENRLNYRSANTKKLEKAFIAADIVYKIRNCGGRFLKYDEKTCLWHDIGDWKAIKKTGQALREDSTNFMSLPDQDTPMETAEDSHIQNSTGRKVSDHEVSDHEDNDDQCQLDKVSGAERDEKKDDDYQDNRRDDDYSNTYIANRIISHLYDDCSRSTTTSSHECMERALNNNNEERTQSCYNHHATDDDEECSFMPISHKQYKTSTDMIMTTKEAVLHNRTTKNRYEAFGIKNLVVDRVPDASPLDVLSRVATEEPALPLIAPYPKPELSPATITLSNLSAPPLLPPLTVSSPSSPHREEQSSPWSSSLASVSQIVTAISQALFQQQHQHQQYQQQQASNIPPPPVYVMNYPSGSLQRISDVAGSCSNIGSSRGTSSNSSHTSPGVSSSLLTPIFRNDSISSSSSPSAITTTDSFCQPQDQQPHEQHQQHESNSMNPIPIVFVVVVPTTL